MSASPSPSAYRPVRLDHATLAVLRGVWWRMRRAGVTLPPEPAVIVIEGGRS